MTTFGDPVSAVERPLWTPPILTSLASAGRARSGTGASSDGDGSTSTAS